MATQSEPCPIAPAGQLGEVKGKITAPDGTIWGAAGTSIDSAGNWNALGTVGTAGSGTVNFVTYTGHDDSYILPDGTVQVVNNQDTPPGVYKVEIDCETEDSKTYQTIAVTKTYSPATFTVTGPSARLLLSPAVGQPGGSVSIAPDSPCPPATGKAPVPQYLWLQFYNLESGAIVGSVVGGRIRADGSWGPVNIPLPVTTQIASYGLSVHCGGLGEVGQVYRYTYYQVTNSISPPVTNYKYVALGDSYSSGEGIEPFFEPNNKCHRSISAYPTFIQQPGHREASILDRVASGGVAWGFQACSGATTTDVLRKKGGRYGDQLPQLSASSSADPGNRERLPVDADTSLVTITVGGDDLGFAKVLEFCGLSEDCTTEPYSNGQRLGDYVNGLINALGPQLDKIFAQIHQQAPLAKIVVAGYPQIFPGSPAEQNCAKLAQKTIGYNNKIYYVGFSQKEQNFLRGQTSRVNQVIADHVNQATSAVFVPVDTIFQFHEVCGNSGEWINGPTGARTNKPPFVKANDQSFHPNADGQRLGYAAAINGVLNGF